MFRCDRCGKEFTTKNCLKRHVILNKKRCKLMKGAVDKTREEMAEDIRIRYLPKFKKKLAIVTNGIDSVDAILNNLDLINSCLKKKIKPYPMKFNNCLKLISIIFRKHPNKCLIQKVPHNTCKLQILKNGKWIKSAIKNIYNLLFNKYIDDPTKNIFHYENFPNVDTKFIAKTYRTAAQFPLNRIKDDMITLFHSSYYKKKEFYKSPETIKKENKQNKKREIEEGLHRMKQIKIKMEREKNRKALQDWDIEKTQIVFSNAIHIIEKNLQLKNNFSYSHIAETLNNEIIENTNKINNKLIDFLHKLPKKDYDYCLDSYYKHYESDFNRDLKNVKL